MESVIATSESCNVGLHGVTHLVEVSARVVCIGLFDGRMFVAVVDDESVVVVQSFEAMPEVVSTLLRRVSFARKMSLLLVLGDNTLRTHMWEESETCFFPSFHVADDVADFDIRSSGAHAFISVLSVSGSVRILRLEKTSSYCMYEHQHTLVNSTLVWVGSSMFCAMNSSGYQFFSVEGRELGAVHSSVTLATALRDSFTRFESENAVTYNDQFAVITKENDSHFPFAAVVLEHYRDEVQELRKIPLLSTSLPTILTSIGPWLVVGGQGFDFYWHASGEYAQSCLEEDEITTSTLAMRALHIGEPNSTSFFQSHRVVSLVDEGVIVTTVHSAQEVLGNLLQNSAFQSRAIEELMQFGQSIGASSLIGHSMIANLSSKSYLFTEYGRLLGRFRVASSSSPAKNNTHCAVCNDALTSSAKICFVCKMRACKTCTEKVNPLDLGYDSIGQSEKSHTRVCHNCDGHCDRNFYRLLHARRYLQAIRYHKTHPHQCRGFSRDEVIALSLEQCFCEEKYDLCARMVGKYVSSAPEWTAWIKNFALVGRLRLLADNYTPQDSDIQATTTLLLQFVKFDTSKLFTLIRRWGPTQYDLEPIRVGVQARLHAKQKEARNISSSCLAEGEWAEYSACCALYIDRDTEMLMRSLLWIVEQIILKENTERSEEQSEERRDERTNVRLLSLYVEHYLMWLPTPQFYSETRRRSGSVFQTRPRKVFATLAQAEIIDVLDFLAEGTNLELVLDAPPVAGVPLVVPLLAHFRVEISKMVVTFDHIRLSNVLDLFTDRLRGCPKQLMDLLQEITQISAIYTASFHQLLADLLVRYAPHQLLGFVKNRQVSNLDWCKLAVEVEQRRMFPELVYITGRRGNDKEAVRIALRCLRDVALAIQYVVDSNDSMLWEELIRHVIQSPELIGKFLDAAGDRYDPSEFLRKVPQENRLVISRLGPRLGQLVVDRKSSLCISQAYLGAVEEDNLQLLKSNRRRALRGQRHQPFARCGYCCQRVTQSHVVGFPGFSDCYHPACFESIFYRDQAVGSVTDRIEAEHRDAFVEIAKFDMKRRFGERDLLSLFPSRVIRHILSFLGPYSLLCCKGLNRNWNACVTQHRRYTARDHTDASLFAQHFAKKLEASVPCRENTVVFSGMERLAVYHSETDEMLP